jgi:hypothetical protein
VLARRRPGALLPVLCAGLAVVSLGLEFGLFRTGTRDRSREQRIGTVLEQIAPVVPQASRCVAFDRHSVDVFAATSYRYRIDGWRFSQPGEPACPAFFLTRLPIPAVEARVRGARVVASERVGSTNRLWVRQGPVQTALANARRVPGRDASPPPQADGELTCAAGSRTRARRSTSRSCSPSATAR